MLFKDWSEAVLSVQQFGAPFTPRVHATSRECVYFSHSFVSRRSISDYSDSASVAMVEKNERVNLEKENSNKNEQDQQGMFHLYNRFPVIILSGELTKFNMFPKGETLHCLKVSNFVVCAVLRGDPSKEIAKPGC